MAIAVDNLADAESLTVEKEEENEEELSPEALAEKEKLEEEMLKRKLRRRRLRRKRRLLKQAVELTTNKGDIQLKKLNDSENVII